MMKQVRGANRPTIMRHLLPIAAVLLLAAVLIAPVTAAEENWLAVNNTAWYNTDATEFTISTAEELAGLAAIANGVAVDSNGVAIAKDGFTGKKITLDANIDLAGKEWTPIASFSGHLDGNDKTISHMTITGDADVKALFVWVGTTYIHDLTIKDAYIAGNTKTAAAALVAERANSGTDIQDVTIDGLTIDVTSDGYVGGAVAHTYRSQLTNVVVQNSVITVNGDAYVGGLVGYSEAWDGTSWNTYTTPVKYTTPSGTEIIATTLLKNCHVDTLTMNVNGGYVGGILGSNRGNDTSLFIHGCTVTNLMVNVTGDNAVEVGGLVGRHLGSYNNYTGSEENLYGFGGLVDCSVSGVIISTNTNTGSKFGGFAGEITNKPSTVTRCSADVDITVTAGDVAGFVVTTYTPSKTPRTFDTCSAAGDVKTENGVASGFIGGVTSSVKNTLISCTATGTVTGTTIASGLIATIPTDANLEVTTCAPASSVTGDSKYAVLPTEQISGTDVTVTIINPTSSTSFVVENGELKSVNDFTIAAVETTATITETGKEPIKISGPAKATISLTDNVVTVYYQITWKNLESDETPLKTEFVEWKTTPTPPEGTPTKEADERYTYAFYGWNPTVKAVDAVTTYTAAYSSTLRSYDITAEESEQGTITVASSAKVDEEVIVAVTPEEGYNLGEITVTKTDDETTTVPVTDGKFTMPTYPVTVSATFTEKEYAVNIGEIKNGEVTTTATDGKAAYKSEVSITATANPVAGFEAGVITVKEVISGKEITVTDGKFEMPAADVIVTATFEPKTFTVTEGTKDANGTITLPNTAKYGSTVIIGVEPNQDYKLATLTVTDDVPVTIGDNQASFIMPAKNVEVTATFAKDVFAIKTAVNPAEGGTITASAISVSTGGSVTVTAAAADGYDFTKFTVDGTDTGATNSYTITGITADTEVIAYFTAKTFSVTQGTITGQGTLEDLPLEDVAYGTDVTIEATAQTGYTFESLTISHSRKSYTTTEKTFKMPAAAVEVSATFAPEEHTLEVVKSNDETVTINPQNPKTGETVIVTVTPKAGYEFVNFTVTGVVGDVTANPGTFTMPAEDAIITINTIAIEYDVRVSPDTVNGEFTVSAEKAIVNDPITVTPVAADGYVLDKITVVSDEDGVMTVDADNTFMMPADNVTVFVTFKLPTPDTPDEPNTPDEPVTPNPPTEEETVIKHVPSDGTVTFPAGLPISTAEFPSGFAGTVTISPSTEASNPTGVERVYDKFDISITGTLPAGQSVVISFSVPLTTLQAAGLGAADACLYHFGSEWTALPTTYSVSGNTVNYKATATDFSPFAIAFKVGSATPAYTPQTPSSSGSSGGSTWLPSTPTETPSEQPTQTPTDTVPTDIPVTQPTSEPSSPGFGVLAVLAGLGAVAVLRRR